MKRNGQFKLGSKNGAPSILVPKAPVNISGPTDDIFSVSEAQLIYNSTASGKN